MGEEEQRGTEGEIEKEIPELWMDGKDRNNGNKEKKLNNIKWEPVVIWI